MSLKYIGCDVVFQEIPDEVSLAFSISGCPNHCDGCHSPWLREDIGKPLTWDNVQEEIGEYHGGITAILFLGGDADPGALVDLADRVHMEYNDKYRVAWYSGCDEPSIDDIVHFDYVKVGHYDKSLGGLDSKTTNQRLYQVTYSGLIDITDNLSKEYGE